MSIQTIPPSTTLVVKDDINANAAVQKNAGVCNPNSPQIIVHVITLHMDTHSLHILLPATISHLDTRPKWFISRRLPSLLRAARPLLHLVSLLVAKSRGSNPFVRVRGLFYDHLFVTTLATAAAYTDEPEEAGSDAEGDGEPEHTEHAAAHGGVDVVGFEHGLEDGG
jgi:hypothetical protein